MSKENKTTTSENTEQNTAEKKKKKIHIKPLMDADEKERVISAIENPVEVPIEEADFVKENSTKEARKQQAMEHFLGVKKDENIDKRQKVFKRIFVIAFIVFVIGVLAFTFYNDFFASNKQFPPFEEVKSLLSKSWFYIILSLLCLFCCFLFKTFKLTIMCKSTTGKFHFKTCLETSVIGNYYNNVTPLATGGQPFEIYHLAKHGVHGGAAASLPIANFFLNQIAFVILGTISLILFANNTLNMPQELIARFPPLFQTLAIIGLVCCFLGPTLVVLFSLMPKVGAWLVNLVMKIGDKLHIVKNPKEMTIKTIRSVVHNAQCLKKIAKTPLVFFPTFILSFMEHIANASIAYFSLKLFGFQLNAPSPVLEWLQVVQTCMILYVAVSFIPTPGNAGAADLSFYLLFEFGLAAGLSFPAMCIWRFFSFYCVIIIGFLFATFRKKADLKRQRFEEQFSGSVPHDDTKPEEKTEEEVSVDEQTNEILKSLAKKEEAKKDIKEDNPEEK